MAENRRAKFIRLANTRVNKTLKAIQLIGNLSNRSNYEYTEDDIRKIHGAINDELKACRKRFESAGMDKENMFRLEE